jgi:hypothetical protein
MRIPHPERCRPNCWQISFHRKADICRERSETWDIEILVRPVYETVTVEIENDISEDQRAIGTPFVG